MQPAYKSDKPGIAPNCRMQLVPVSAGDVASAPPSSPLAQLPEGAVRIVGAAHRLVRFDSLYFDSKKCKLKFQNDPAGAANRYQGDADD
jgi:hypothetical protein